MEIEDFSFTKPDDNSLDVTEAAFCFGSLTLNPSLAPSTPTGFQFDLPSIEKLNTKPFSPSKKSPQVKPSPNPTSPLIPGFEFDTSGLDKNFSFLADPPKFALNQLGEDDEFAFRGSKPFRTNEEAPFKFHFDPSFDSKNTNFGLSGDGEAFLGESKYQIPSQVDPPLQISEQPPTENQEPEIVPDLGPEIPEEEIVLTPGMNFLLLSETTKSDAVKTFPYFEDIELTTVMRKIDSDIRKCKKELKPNTKLIFGILQNQRLTERIQSLVSKKEIVEKIRKNNLEILKVEEDQVIADFPREIWFHLLTFLPWHSCLQFSAICKSNYFFFWLNLKKLDFEVSDPTPLFNIMRLLHSPSQITQLSFKIESVRGGLNLGLSHSLGYLTNLRILELSGVEISNTFNDVFSKLTKIHILKIGSVTNEPTWLSNFTLLQEASLIFSKIETYTNNFGVHFSTLHRLKELEIIFTETPKIDKAFSLIDNLSNLLGLSSLKIRINKPATNELLFEVKTFGFERIKALDSFILDGVEILVENGFKEQILHSDLIGRKFTDAWNRTP